MTDLSITMDVKDLIAAYAAAKGIPMAKVIRNASRDFAQAAYKATPTAVKSSSDYYWYKGADGKRHYLHKRMVKRKTFRAADGSKRRKLVLKSGRDLEGSLHRVRVAKGWSKASWIGVFKALGMDAPKRAKTAPEKAETLSSIAEAASGATAKATITDIIRFNRFGKGTDTRSGEIARAGYVLAAKRIMRDVVKTLKETWRNGNASNAN